MVEERRGGRLVGAMCGKVPITIARALRVDGSWWRRGEGKGKITSTPLCGEGVACCGAKGAPPVVEESHRDNHQGGTSCRVAGGLKGGRAGVEELFFTIFVVTKTG